MYNNAPNEKNDSPYGVANLKMTPYTISNNVDMVDLCINCHANKKLNQNTSYIVYQSPLYMVALLSTQSFHIQLFSFRDIRMHMESNN
jgi:hypothetical protein